MCDINANGPPVGLCLHHGAIAGEGAYVARGEERSVEEKCW